MMGFGVFIEAHETSDQVAPLFHVIFFLTNVIVVVACNAAAGYAGIVELEIQFFPSVVTSWSRNADDIMPAVFANG